MTPSKWIRSSGASRFFFCRPDISRDRTRRGSSQSPTCPPGRAPSPASPALPTAGERQKGERPSDHPEPPPHFPERTVLRLASRAFASPNLRVCRPRFNDSDSIADHRRTTTYIVKLSPRRARTRLPTGIGVFHRVCAHGCVHKFLTRIFATRMHGTKQGSEADLDGVVDLAEGEV